MNVVSRMGRFAAACLLLGLGACGGGGGGDEGGGTPPPSPPPTGIGPAGGTVLGPNGAKVEIPAGALTTNVDIKVELTVAGAPALPTGFTAAGQMFAFTPHGTTFAVPVTMTLPFDPASAPAGTTPALYKTNTQNQWEEVPGTAFGAGSVSAQVTSFSDVTVVTEPFFIGSVGREWTFNELIGVSAQPFRLQGATVSGGLLSEFRDLGLADFDAEFALIDGRTIAPDGRANGAIGASEDGTTFYVAAEAPLQNANIAGVPLGSEAILVQVHTFTKRTDSASLTFAMPQAVIDAHDENAVLGRECPANRVLGELCILIEGSLAIELEVFGTEPTPDPIFNLIFQLSGGVALNGFAENWRFRPSSNAWSRVPLWEEEDFQFVIEDLADTDESHALLTLIDSPTHVVDISSIEVGEAFHVRVTAKASAFNMIAGPPSELRTSVGAYMRESLTIGGAVLEFAGLDLIDTPVPLPLPPPSQEQTYVVPASCAGGPDPAAGVIEFSADSYSILESGSTLGITVARTGGSVGAVTATFTTSDGTAVAGADYTAVNSSVFFADGDAAPRVVRVPIVQDEIAGEPDRTVNLALSEPGGCVTLGTRTTALLAIHDDEVPPPPPPTSSFLDPTFGSEGLAHSERFGGGRSAMALQADGKVIMVGGSFVDFILARFNADGTLDTSFDDGDGGDGKVTTDMVPGEQEEALGVAIQADGKIVVVGYTGVDTTPPQPSLPPNFALARYNTNGTLDTSFGVGGKITTGVAGMAHAVAIQPDGKIVVAGEVPTGVSNGPDFSDFRLARFNTDGSPDASFGLGGQIATDVADGTNSARNIVLQPNGAIVVSGKPQGSTIGFDHTDVVRYNADGSPDASFGPDASVGAAGELALPGRTVGAGLALQSDGKLVLVGSLDTSIAPAVPGTVTEFAVMRLNADGSPDTAFGNAGTGTLSTAITAGQRDSAGAVALQADGRIIVAGSSKNINRDFAVARYNSNGTLDTSFGNGGTLTIDFFFFTDIAESVAIQPDGKIVLGGPAVDIFTGYGVARVVP